MIMMNKSRISEEPPQPLEDVRGEDRCEYVQLDGEGWFKISSVHRLPEFMMTLASSSNHWMFVSSAGALTAGRQNADNALFPYYSAEKICDTRMATGPRTIVWLKDADYAKLRWQPFFDLPLLSGNIIRNLYKSPLGNRICFEEVNYDLELIFRYRWACSHRSGFIRTARIVNFGNQTRSIDLVDGIQNIMPAGVDQEFQLRFGNLADAYKKNELTDAGLGIFYLSSIPTDRAEPSEGLRSTAVWSTRPANETLISSMQLEHFLNGGGVETERDIRGQRGAYLLNHQFDLEPDGQLDWDIVAETKLDHADLSDLTARIKGNDVRDEIAIEMADGEQRLSRLIANADGFQFGARWGRNQRHQSNVLFNIMRGGTPWDNYRICTDDLRQHVAKTNRRAAAENHDFLAGLPKTIERDSLIDAARRHGEKQLLRIVMEYMPLVFSRRHGDPTRPWNKFSINSPVGGDEKSFDYQGNWRDIFQNWEALAVSFPQFVESMICRFVNATTADGYNPYRLTKNGFEWEAPDPHERWSNIGYWGDHQIIYLAKLLELSNRFFPGQIDGLLDDRMFVFANVPYQIKPCREVFADPQNTVVFDHGLAQRISSLVSQLGNDGKLLRDDEAQIQQSTLGEKLLIPALVKMSNFVPDGGIWLNTQRPEWNDANNALVGNGLSVVTCCYLRRYLSFLRDWFGSSAVDSFEVSANVVALFTRIQVAILPYVGGPPAEITPAERHQVVMDLSKAGSDYRSDLYETGFSGSRKTVSLSECRVFFDQCIQILEATIRSNRRADGLYHSYNLMSRDVENEIHIERLYEMLEGQVAVLSCGLLQPDEAIRALDALRSSAMYRQDQQSYMLYPNRRLPRFMEKNVIPSGLVNQSALLKKMIERGDPTIVRKDQSGNCHFNGDFRNAADVQAAVAEVEKNGEYADVIGGAALQLASIFKNMFCHNRFTGRSGTFFAYEGLGSIYWHMVSKLGLAVAENYWWAKDAGASGDQLEKLASHLREIRDGIGAEKSPSQYGAFPGDPYSHTPEQAGVKQPGMTGQVKEDILFRFAEIGVRVDDGCLSFDPVLLEAIEFHQPGSAMPVPAVFDLPEPTVGAFLFSLCGVQVAYVRSGEPGIRIFNADGRVDSSAGWGLNREQSRRLFARDGSINRIEVAIGPENDV